MCFIQFQTRLGVICAAHGAISYVEKKSAERFGECVRETIENLGYRAASLAPSDIHQVLINVCHDLILGCAAESIFVGCNACERALFLCTVYSEWLYQRG